MKRSSAFDVSSPQQRDAKQIRRSGRIKALVSSSSAPGFGNGTVNLKNPSSQERAQALMATSQLQALPLVLAQSGFLFQHEAQNAAATCRDWGAIWQEAKTDLPAECQVEIRVGFDNPRCEWPYWVECRDLEDDIPSQAFARQIFDKVNNLKVAAKRSETEKRKARDNLPKWGVDFHQVELYVRGPNSENPGGIGMELYKHCPANESESSKTWTRVRGWSVGLTVNLMIWTGLGPRAMSLYNEDREILWDWDFVAPPVPLPIAIMAMIGGMLRRVRDEVEDGGDPDVVGMPPGMNADANNERAAAAAPRNDDDDDDEGPLRVVRVMRRPPNFGIFAALLNALDSDDEEGED